MADRKEIAAQWLIRRDAGLSPAESQEFEAWLDREAGNREAFGRAERLWSQMSVAATDESLAAEADELERSLRRTPLRPKYRTKSLPIFFRWTVGLAAAAAVVVLWPRPKTYTVTPSAARRQILPDGSIVLLNGDARIAADYTAGFRRIQLIAGEAHFEVAKNPLRPFIVSAGPIAVRAVGTAFDVRLGNQTAEVLVTEGKVGVRTGAEPIGAPEQFPAPLALGQRGRLEITGDRPGDLMVDAPSAAEVDAMLDWESAHFAFRQTPLDQVVKAFNAANPGRRFVLGDPALKQRTLSGIFRADNFEGFARLLRASLDVVAEPGPDGVTVLRAAP